jgi:protein-disulfide isomerase
METYADTELVRFEYHHFAFLGNESEEAAAASECAAEQGQFWPYHDTVFANQRGENMGAFSSDNLLAFAAALDLDTEAFESCLRSGRFDGEVRAETASGQERGVRSTPTLFINGEMVEGAIPFSELQSRVEAALSEAGVGR